MTNLPYVYAALLDILGYRNHLNADRSSGSLDFKNALVNALSVLTTVNDAIYKCQSISDTITITCSSRDDFVEFLEVLKSVQIAFLRNGLHLRGGITFQQHFHSGNITYSHAFARAYELESTYAIYPRIVIDRNIIDMFDSRSMLRELLNPKLICHQNNVFFLNILDESNWNEIFEAAKIIFGKSEKELQKNENALIKHAWFEEYLMSSPYVNSNSKRYIPCIEIYKN